MGSDPVILGFDTSAAHCAAALLAGGTIRAEAHEDMARGQAERLMPLLEEVLVGQQVGWRDLDAVAVGIGPGNFTGIRISVSAARGLALGLGIPAIGISGFEMLLDPDDPGPVLVSLPAPRDMAYVQPFAHGRATAAPRLVDPAALPSDLAPVPRVLGHRAARIAEASGAEARDAALSDIGPRLVRRAALRLAHASQPHERPAPLYVRPADAAPASDPPPVLLP